VPRTREQEFEGAEVVRRLEDERLKKTGEKKMLGWE
jgi:hypothetical protein